MSDPSAIEVATKRLMQAIDTLEAAVERRLDAARGEEKLVEQVSALGADRSRLASDLDAMTARSRRLEAANREVAGRLDTAMDSIRSVIGAHER
jgi:hypothetical protein